MGRYIVWKHHGWGEWGFEQFDNSEKAREAFEASFEECMLVEVLESRLNVSEEEE